MLREDKPRYRGPLSERVAGLRCVRDDCGLREAHTYAAILAGDWLPGGLLMIKKLAAPAVVAAAAVAAAVTAASPSTAKAPSEWTRCMNEERDQCMEFHTGDELYQCVLNAWLNTCAGKDGSPQGAETFCYHEGGRKYCI